ncbi:MAG: hypothetical protein QXT45_07645 [Candidatus Bilamarchaeaceae archaeon]
MPSIPFFVDIDLGLTSKVINCPNPSNPNDVATKAYVDSYAEGLAWKDSARVATTSNININSPPSSIDGITLNINDRILVKDQTNAAENGIYVYNGSGNPLTRASDANAPHEFNSAVISIDEGTVNANTTWRCNTINPTLGTTPITWAQFGSSIPDATESTKGKIQIATQSETNAGTDDTKAITPLKLANWSGRKLKYATTFGDTTNTTYTITHNLGTQDIVASVRRTSDNKIVYCEIEVTNSNSVTVRFNTAPGNNSMRITIIG